MKENKQNGEWNGWANTDGLNPWKMNRYERSKDPIPQSTRPEVRVEDEGGATEPEWVDVTPVVNDIVRTIRNGEDPNVPPQRERQKVWGGRSKGELQPNVPVVLTGKGINPGEATPFQEANYMLLNGIETDANGDIIVPEDRIIQS